MSYQMELDRQYRNGREEGIKQGMEKGSAELATENINKLNKILIVEKKYDEIEKISTKRVPKELMKKYNIIED